MLDGSSAQTIRQGFSLGNYAHRHVLPAGHRDDPCQQTFELNLPAFYDAAKVRFNTLEY